MTVRYSKIILVWAIALYSSLVVFNNLTDYGSNYAFVSHVLKMDTTFAGNQGMWRAVDSPFIANALYWLIIATETAVALLCWAGGWRLLRSVRDVRAFNGAKALAVAGLTLGILLWFSGFLTIGGEWFLMWQSQTWNGQEAAFRLVAVLGIVLLYTVQPDHD